MTQHEYEGVRVLRNYDFDTLGAPFKVILVNGVTTSVDPDTGKELVEVPDTIGLLGAVVRTRALHPRKLSGDDLRFIRRALGVRAKSVAHFLDMSPEHLSRCESGGKALSSTTEKMFRFGAFCATYFENPDELFVDIKEAKLKETDQFADPERVERFVKTFLRLKIKAVFDPEDKLCFRFERRPRRVKHEEPACEEPKKDWSAEPALAA